MERKIGEKFTDNGVLLEVVEKKELCFGCYYFENITTVNCSKESYDALLGNCANVIFKQVEEKTMTNEELDIKAREHAKDYSGAMWATARESYIAGFRDAEEKTRWIPITERLPEIRKEEYSILTKDDEGNIYINLVHKQVDIDYLSVFTHWKEII